MGATFMRLAIEPLTPPIKSADAYRLAWWIFDNVTTKFRVPIETDVRNYINEISGPERQQIHNGKRPYSRQSLDYIFPDFLGAAGVAAELTQHWFELCLALWESELELYFKRYNVRLLSAVTPLHQCVRNARWLTLRDRNWSINSFDNSEPYLLSQTWNDREQLNLDQLTPEERAYFDAVQRSGLCHCSFCRLLIPDAEGEAQLKARVLAADSMQERGACGLWIASLLAPSAELLQWLLDIGLPHLGPETHFQFSPAKHALQLLGQRNPAARAFLQAAHDHPNEVTRQAIAWMLRPNG